jgi:uncharacterized membrane protein
MDGPIKAIIEAGKGSIDFIAFALIAILTFAGLIKGVEFLAAAGMAVVLAVLWVIMRYALVALQSHERLRRLKESATIDAQEKLARYATKDELEDLFSDLERIGDDHGS